MRLSFWRTGTEKEQERFWFFEAFILKPEEKRLSKGCCTLFASKSFRF